MSHEATHHSPESHFEGERLYRSFIESLSLVRTVEKRYSSAVLRVPEQAIGDTVAAEKFSDIRSLGDRIEELYFGNSERQHQYDQLIDRSLSGHIEEHPVLYTALSEPGLAEEAKLLVRTGMLAQLRQKQLELARHDRRFGREEGQEPIPRRESSNTDDLIKFNHTVRELIESPLGRKMNLDREKLGEIIKLIFPGDPQAAEGVEKGLALEVATKHMFRRLVLTADIDKAIVYGDLKDDKVGGDFVLYPGTEHQMYLDVKQSPPERIRHHLSDEQLRQPGSFIVNDRKAVLWLGSAQQVGKNFSVPAEFRDAASDLLEELNLQLVA